jgi:1D-myo-inositol-tetrakisphosphate 5-kinase/inositol-polyphosphate multikinase
LQTENGLVLKPVQSFPRGEREHNFFKRIFMSDESDLNNDEKELKLLLPQYRGSLTHNESKTLLNFFLIFLIDTTDFCVNFLIKVIYIKMDDLAYGIKHPAIIDFKIGKQTYDPEATDEKIKRQRLKYPPVEKIGFQLLGMRVINLIFRLQFIKTKADYIFFLKFNPRFSIQKIKLFLIMIKSLGEL